MEKRKLTQGQVDGIIKAHELWVNTRGQKGECADFSNAVLEGIKIKGELMRADFTSAEFVRCIFDRCNAIDAIFHNTKIMSTRFFVSRFAYGNFSYAEISNCDFMDTNMRSVAMTGAAISESRFHNCVLSRANFSSAKIEDCQMEYTQLSGAQFSESFEGVSADIHTEFYYSCCPEEGAFIGFKKAWYDNNHVVVKLLIPDDAKRSSACSRKCRASKAKVLAIYDTEKNRLHDSAIAVSDYDYHFTYSVGKTVVVDDFDENRWNECSSGIHFFLSFNEAAQYEF